MEDFDMDDMLRKLLTAFLAFIMAVAIFGIIGALAGCKSVEYVKVPEYHTEYKREEGQRVLQRFGICSAARRHLIL